MTGAEIPNSIPSKEDSNRGLEGAVLPEKDFRAGRKKNPSTSLYIEISYNEN